MPTTDISMIQSKVIAINYLDDAAAVRKHWDFRFNKRTVFWIDAADCSGHEILKKLQESMMAQGISNMMGERCIVVYLLDSTKENMQEIAKDIWSHTLRIRQMLMCTVQLVVQYTYVGTVGIDSVTVQKKNIGWLSKGNDNAPAGIQHRLCMIASPVLGADGGNSWKAAIVLLDILRRHNAPTTLLPEAGDGVVNNDVGFLRYAEYDEKTRDALQQELQDTTERLSAQNGEVLKAAITNLLDETRKRIDVDFAIHAEYHPQHTHMIVENSGILKNQQSKAKKGTYAPYNEAAEATLYAVKATANRMCKEIALRYDHLAQNAAKWLNDVIKETKVSCDVLMSKSAVRALLLVDQYQSSRNIPHIEELPYLPAGSQKDIGTFLVNMKEYAKYTGEQAVVSAIWNAFEAIDSARFEKEKALLEQKQSKLNIELLNLPTARKFAQDSTAAGLDLRESQFFPISAGGDSRKYMIVRGQDMLREVNDLGVNALTIHEFAGGLENLDSAPMKAVQYVTRNYSEADLNELLPEVN